MVGSIIKDFLVAQGYDGLLNVEGECGCKLADIGDCETLMVDCHPGYVWKADGKMHRVKEKKCCVWVRLTTTGIGDIWDTGCAGGHVFPCGGDSPADSGYKFCPQCGKETEY